MYPTKSVIYWIPFTSGPRLLYKTFYSGSDNFGPFTIPEVSISFTEDINLLESYFNLFTHRKKLRIVQPLGPMKSFREPGREAEHFLFITVCYETD